MRLNLFSFFVCPGRHGRNWRSTAPFGSGVRYVLSFASQIWWVPFVPRVAGMQHTSPNLTLFDTHGEIANCQHESWTFMLKNFLTGSAAHQIANRMKRAGVSVEIVRERGLAYLVSELEEYKQANRLPFLPQALSFVYKKNNYQKKIALLEIWLTF